MHFLEKLAQHILTKPKEDLKDLVVVLPNIRAKLFLNNHIKNKAETAIFLPVSYSSQELMEKLSGMKSADDFLLMSKLYKAYPKTEKEEMTFDLFMNWGNSLLQDIKEIDHQMVDADALFSELSDIRRMEAWSPDASGLSEIQQKYLTFCQRLPALFKTFEAEMLKEGMGHLGFLEKRAYHNLNSLEPDPSKKYIIAGFNALTKAEEGIFNWISEHHNCEFFWDYDHYYLDDQIHEAGHFGRINQQKKAPFNWVFNDFKEIEKKVKVYKCTTGYEQSFVVSEILKTIDTKDNLLKTAVVLADESLLLPVLQSLPNKITSVNVTMGYPLSQSPYYALFESIVKMYINLRIDPSSENGGFYHKDVQRFLYSDAVKQMAENNGGKLIGDFIKKNTLEKQIYIEGERINALLKDMFGIQDVHFKEEKSSSNIVELFKTIILVLDQKLNTENRLLDKINREFLLHHLEVLEQVKNMMEALGETLDMITFHKIWRHYTKLAKVQFTGEPLNGLQIMGLLESRNLDFDNVIILNVNEGTLPADKKFGSLIPNDLKRKNNMHLHKEKDAIFSYHFYRLLQRSKNVNLLYSSQLDDLGGGEKSRYIIQLEKELRQHQPAHEMVEINASSAMDILAVETKHVQKTAYLLDLITQRMSKGLSPTSLSTYLNCPLDFYYKYIVGIKEQKNMVENLEADVLGSAIHDTLEELYRPFIGKILHVSNIEDMRKNYQKVLQKKFEFYVSKHYLLKGKNLLSFEMAKELLERYFSIELKNVQNNEIELVDLELSLERECLIDIDNKPVKIKLNGKIDRVEKKNGIWNLIDYKSGNILKSDTSMKVMEEILEGKSKALQLLTYAFLFEKTQPNQPISAGLYPLKAYNLGYLPLQIEKNHLIDASILDAYKKCIVQIVGNMLNPDQDFMHNEVSTYCTFC